MATPEGPQESKYALLSTLLDKFEENRQYGRLLIVACFVLGTALLLPRVNVREFQYEPGKVWQDGDLIANFDFSIHKKETDYRRELQAADDNTPEAFLLVPGQQENNRRALLQFFVTLQQASRQWQQVKQNRADSATAMLKRLPPGLEAEDLAYVAANPNVAVRLQTLAAAANDRATRVALLDRDLALIKGDFVSLRVKENEETVVEKRTCFDATTLSAMVDAQTKDQALSVKRILKSAVTTFCKPTYQYNKQLYEMDLAANSAAVSPYYGKVETGRLIISRGQRITPELSDILQSYHREKEMRSGQTVLLLVFAGQLIVVGMLAWLTINFLRVNRREVYRNNRKTGLLFFIFFLTTLLNVLVLYANSQFNSRLDLNFYYLVPMSMAPIIITVFFDDRIGFFCNIIIALLAGFIIQNNFEYFFIQICAGSVAVHSLTILRRRSQFFTTAGTLLLTYWAAYLGYNFYIKGAWADINFYNLALFIINVLFTLATYPLIYFFEKLFGITSDLTYIELLDTDHPLLKELSLKAAGTYQHSLQVANIAEAVANKIGANALQVRVGALFHDIGKIYQPEFFVENQREGYNPHERLSPQMSAEIIINHVTYGEELAREHNLPEEVVDFIRTHHGTSRVEYFYRWHLRNHPNEVTDESEFRYKGPLPTTKEMAILMMADSAEAASRSLKNPTQEELQALVENIVSYKINDDQLVEARITFKDLYTIKKEILNILLNIYHTRLEYPSRVPRPAAVTT
jgi:putative nucleotidyltransferase with HDIG domain